MQLRNTLKNFYNYTTQAIHSLITTNDKNNEISQILWFNLFTRHFESYLGLFLLLLQINHWAICHGHHVRLGLWNFQ